MKYGWLIGIWCLLTACADNKPELPVNQGRLRLNMAVEGIYSFDQYIFSLTVYAFRKAEDGTYRFFEVLTTLNKAEVQQLLPANRKENSVQVKTIEVNLPVGDYRLYFMANAEAEGEKIVGQTLAPDLRIYYPAAGLYYSYFRGECEVEVGAETTSVEVVLQRTISRLLLEIQNVPAQLDSIYVEVNHMAEAIGLDGSLYGDRASRQERYKVKVEKPYETIKLFCDIFVFPSVGESSDLNLSFLSQSGEWHVKNIPVHFIPDKYVQMKASISSKEGTLLSYEAVFTFFIMMDWREIQLPDFVLKPVA